MHRFEKRIFKIRLFFYYNEKKLLYGDEENDIQEHVPLKNDLMKIKQTLLIKRFVLAPKNAPRFKVTSVEWGATFRALRSRATRCYDSEWCLFGGRLDVKVLSGDKIDGQIDFCWHSSTLRAVTKFQELIYKWTASRSSSASTINSVHESFMASFVYASAVAKTSQLSGLNFFSLAFPRVAITEVIEINLRFVFAAIWKLNFVGEKFEV